ncbi:MAG TPA: DUF3365 domain-containing protein [Pseudomonadota bacterium]|nr:DUF3365 domain-containing protein [Pseudomonadota bacterium]
MNLLACLCRALPATGLALAATLAGAQSPVAAGSGPAEAELARAQAAVSDLGQSLRAALKARLEQGGAVDAVDFCHEQAPAIAAAVSARHGVRVGRTALRHRSPGNAPNDWQLAVLQDFAVQVAAGAPAATLRASLRTGLPDGVALRYAQGIPTEPVCLACHGAAIAAPVAAAIAARYPHDTATGFAEGELRGMFWAELDATAPP